MHTVFKKIAVTVISVGIVLSVFSSCSDDIVLPPIPTLIGEYSGHYSLIDYTLGGVGDTLIDIDVHWVFRKNSYELEDTTKTICTPSGAYIWSGTTVNLEENFDGNSGGVCNPSLNPIGDFSILRPADSLILKQNIDNIFKEISLKKIQ